MFLSCLSDSSPLQERVQVIMNCKQIIYEFRTFLGQINFSSFIIKGRSKEPKSFHECLRHTTKKDKSKISFTDETKQQFETSKNNLANTVLLSFSSPSYLRHYLQMLHTMKYVQIHCKLKTEFQNQYHFTQKFKHDSTKI